MPPLHTSNSDLILSFDASDILGDHDKSLFLHRRPLLNADTMIRKGHFKSALEIYYRAVAKIKNPEVQNKIQQNISELQGYLKTTDPQFEKKIAKKYSDYREKEFTESLKELTENLSDSLTEKLNILKQIETVPEPSSKQEFSEKPTVSKKSDYPDLKPLDLGALDAKGKQKTKEKESVEDEPEEIEGTLEYNKDEETSKIEKEKKPKKANIKVDKDSASIQAEEAEIKNESAEFKGDTSIQNATFDSDSLQMESQNIINQSQASSDQITSDKNEMSQEKQSKLPAIEDKIAYPESIPSESKTVEEVRLIKEKILDVETGWKELEKEGPKPKADKDYAPLMKKYEVGNIEIPESTEFITTEFKPDENKNIPSSSSYKAQGKTKFGSTLDRSDLSEGILTDDSNKDLITDENQQQPFNVPTLPPPLPININDWLSNLFFSKEWNKFKPLPMKERRSGKDRRVSTSNQIPKGIKKDRRSGIERRKQNSDLLSEREAFLQDWQRENRSYPPVPSPSYNMPSPLDNGTPSQEIPNQEQMDSSLRTMEFLPRDPSSFEKTPTTDELIKVDLPNPEEIFIKKPIDQNEIEKEHIPSNIAETLTRYIPANEELGLPESDKGLVKIDLPDPITQKADTVELPQREVSGEIEVSSKDGTGITKDAPKQIPANNDRARDTSGMGPLPYTPEAYQIPEELKIELPDPDDFVRTKSGHLIDPFAPEEIPEINMIEGDGPQDTESGEEGPEISEIPELPPPPPEPERTIHGILELKPPEIDDAPFLTLTYDFSKIPHPFKLSKNYSIMEYSYYKYKPMLMKAQEFARRKMLKNALNYYRVIKSQNIPPELKNMINRNIIDITEFLEKFIMSKGG